MSDLPKHVRRALWDAATQAHEEELRRALLPLAADFDGWRAGALGSFQQHLAVAIQAVEEILGRSDDKGE